MTLLFFYKSRSPIAGGSTPPDEGGIQGNYYKEGKINPYFYQQQPKNITVILNKKNKNQEALELLTTKDRGRLKAVFGDDYVRQIELILLTMMLDEDMH